MTALGYFPNHPLVSGYSIRCNLTLPSQNPTYVRTLLLPWYSWQREGHCTTVYLCVLCVLACLTSNHAVLCRSLPTVCEQQFCYTSVESTRYVCKRTQVYKPCCCVLVLHHVKTVIWNRPLLLYGYCLLRTITRATLYQGTLCCHAATRWHWLLL